MALYPEIILIFCAILVLLAKKYENKAKTIFIIAVTAYMLHVIDFKVNYLQNIASIKLVFTIIILFSGMYAFWCNRLREVIALLIYGFSALRIIDAHHLIEIFCCIELMMIASAYIIFQGRNRASKAAGLRYLKMHIIAGTLILLGVIHHYENTGSFYLSKMSDYLSENSNNPYSNYLLGIGLLINAAIFPFSAWLPDSYPRSTSSGTLILSVFTTKISIYLLAKIYYGNENLILLGVVTIVYAIFYMLVSTQLRRVIAYYIIMQNGILLSVVGSKNFDNINYLIGLSSLYCFFAMFVVSYLKEKNNLGSFIQLNDKSIYKKSIFSLTIASLFIIGLPYSISFPVKYYASHNTQYFSGQLVEYSLYLTSLATLGKFYAFYRKHKNFYWQMDKIFLLIFAVIFVCGLALNFSIPDLLIYSVKKTIYLLIFLFICGWFKNFLIQKEDQLFPDIDWIYRVFLYSIYSHCLKIIIKSWDFVSCKVLEIREEVSVYSQKSYKNLKQQNYFANINYDFYMAAIVIIIMVVLL